MRIIFRHLLPNAITPAVVYWMTDMALAILLGSSLGYLGLGAQPPAAEWGVLIADGKNFFTQAPWITLFPGAVIVLAVLLNAIQYRRRVKLPSPTGGSPTSPQKDKATTADPALEKTAG